MRSKPVNQIQEFFIVIGQTIRKIEFIFGEDGKCTSNACWTIIFSMRTKPLYADV